MRYDRTEALFTFRPAWFVVLFHDACYELGSTFRLECFLHYGTSYPKRLGKPFSFYHSIYIMIYVYLYSITGSTWLMAWFIGFGTDFSSFSCVCVSVRG